MSEKMEHPPIKGSNYFQLVMMTWADIIKTGHKTQKKLSNNGLVTLEFPDTSFGSPIGRWTKIEAGKLKMIGTLPNSQILLESFLKNHPLFIDNPELSLAYPLIYGGAKDNLRKFKEEYPNFHQLVFELSLSTENIERNKTGPKMNRGELIIFSLTDPIGGDKHYGGVVFERHRATIDFRHVDNSELMELQTFMRSLTASNTD